MGPKYRERRLHIRGAVYLRAKDMVSSLDAATTAAQRGLRTDLDHFLGEELAMAWAGARRCVKYLLLLLGGHGGVGPAVHPAFVTLEFRGSDEGACQARLRPFWASASPHAAVSLCCLSPGQNSSALLV